MHNRQTTKSTSPLWWYGIRQTRSPVTLPLLALIAVKDQLWYGVSNAISPSSSLDDVYRF